MENFILNIKPSNNQSKKSIVNLIKKLIFDKYTGWVPLISFVIISSIISYANIAYGSIVGIVVIFSLVVPLMIYFMIVKPYFGIMCYLTFAYTIMWFYRYLGVVGFPYGTIMDGMLVIFILGVFVQQKKQKDWLVFKNSISVFILIWVLYNFLQIFNPVADSKLAWLYTIRSMALVTLMYFIFVFNIRTKKNIRIIFKWWIFFSFVAACYAFKQEYFGFDAIEQRWLDSSPSDAELLFLAGHWRKFSMFSDPVTFAYNMATASMLCIALITGPIKIYKKIILGFLAIFFLYVMLFSGTRAVNPLIPIGLILFAILKFNKKILLFTISSFLFIGFLIILPTSNKNILRFQTAFRPKQDASYQLREINQAKIKPFIYSHPFGGGLGASGEWGVRFSPNSYLASFQPDSGYVRTTVELGWIGLLIFSLMIVVILQKGINNYFKIKDPELKSYSLAVVLIVFVWNVGNFPQQAIVQYPSNVLFFLSVAFIPVIFRIDQQQNILSDNL